MLTVMIIEGQQKMRVELQLALEALGFRVICAWDAQDVRGFLASHDDRIDIAVVGGSVIGPEADLLRVLQGRFPAIKFILLQPDDPEMLLPTGHVVVGRSRTPMLAFSGKFLPEELEQILAAGFDEVISKPIDVLKLRQLVETFCVIGGISRQQKP